jgi:hypothetical protein
LGGDDTVNPNNTESTCPDGLTTTFLGAKSQAQCFTKPGYGRASIRISDGTILLSGVLCPVGTFNVGGNTASCQKCGVGLTTATNGSKTWSDCSELPLELSAAAAAAGAPGAVYCLDESYPQQLTAFMQYFDLSVAQHLIWHCTSAH